jgi:Ca2+-transporting ATPase
VFLWGAGIASLVLTTLVIYVPFLAKAFEFEHISAKEYIIAVLIAACVIPIVEIVKLIQRTVEKRKQS